MLIPTFSPQGDGNTTESSASLRDRNVDPYLFPARGRKLSAETCIRTTHSCRVDPYLFPARGRKQWGLGSGRYANVVLIPTFSPQGDGNVEALTTYGADHVDPYLFPARGRKLLLRQGMTKPAYSLIPTFSPQGDGNLWYTSSEPPF